MSKKEESINLEIKKAPEELTQRDLDTINGGFGLCWGEGCDHCYGKKSDSSS